MKKLEQQAVSKSHADVPIPTGLMEYAVNPVRTALKGIPQTGDGGANEHIFFSWTNIDIGTASI